MRALAAELPPLLVVENSDEDFAALGWAMRQLGLRHPLVRCADGDEALEYLFGRGPGAPSGAADAHHPGLILLDLNLAAIDGEEVLRQIKADDALCTIPVVIWTTSARHEDVMRCYRSGANSYILKRAGLNRLLDELRTILHYWFDMVVLPDGGRA